MSNAAWDQVNFTGGEWSPYAQGRIDLPTYRTALALCSNAIPLEEGAWTRRSGTRHGGYSNRGYFSKEFRFPFGADSPYTIEISYNSGSSWMTFWRDGQRVTDSVQTLDNANVPTGSPATFTTTANLSTTGWASGDDILIQSQNGATSWPVTNSSLNGATLINRVFTITTTGAKTFTMVDAVTGAAVNASSFTYDNMVTNTFHRVTKNTCPYTTATEVSITRAVYISDGTPSNNVAILLLNQNHAPIQVVGFYEANGGDGFAGFTKSTPSFVDGPYQPQEGGTITLGAATGTVSFTHSGTKINNGAGFASNDVGRTMRFLTQPPVWATGTSYNAGDTVTLQAGVNYGSGSIPFQDSTFWVAFVANTGSQPDQNPTIWAPYSNGNQWTYGTVATVTNDHSGTVTIVGPDIPNFANCIYWQMDYFSWFWGWPNGGLFSDGRLWLFGVTATEGRFDASMAGLNSNFNFSPTNFYGEVGDANAISDTIIDPRPSNIMWMAEDPNGIVLGREHDEWTIRPGTGVGSITPTNIQAKHASSYGSGYLTESVRAGATLTFIDRTFRRMVELVSDTFSNKLTGRIMNQFARHIGRGLFKRGAFQDSIIPIIWLCDFAGALFGCNYRRIGTYATQPPELEGWHRHTLGSTWTVSDVADSSNYSTNAQQDQSADAVYLTTYDGTHYHIEMLQPLFDTESTAINGWFLDSAPAWVQGRDPALDSGSAGITIYGLWHLVGKVVTVAIAGLNFGTATVSATGTVNVNYAADPEGLGTAVYLQSLSGTYTYGCPLDLKISGSRAQITVPVVVGFPFTSEGQTVRPNDQQGAHLADGPGLAELRRVVRYGMLLNNTGGFVVGTSSGHTFPSNLCSTNDQTSLGASTMFSGVYWDVVDDNYTYDGQLYWASSGIYPMTVMATASFLRTDERGVETAQR